MIQEATEIMNKMKNMPGMGNIQSMLNKMGMGAMSGMGGMGGMGGKLNTGAMESQLNNRLKLAKTKERIRKKAEANAKAKLEANIKAQLEFQQAQTQPQMSDEELLKFINSTDKVGKKSKTNKSKLK